MPSSPRRVAFTISLLALAAAALLLYIRHKSSSSGRTNKEDGDRPLREPNKKALLIGIRYKNARSASGTTLDLKEAPHLEVKIWRELLIDYFGYTESEITCMVDDDSDSNLAVGFWPCYQNILAQLEALVREVQPGDKRFLFVAAHGGQLQYTENFTEKNKAGGVPVFYSVECGGERLFQINNQEMRRILVDGLPERAKLTVVFELCNSGTLLDLPFRVDTYPNSPATVTPTREDAEDVPGHILCLSACEDWQEARHWRSKGNAEQGIITSIVSCSLRKNASPGSLPRLGLVQLHQELLHASVQKHSKDAQTPVATIGKTLSEERLKRLYLRP